MQLLPTPLTTDAQGAGGHGDGGRDLRTTVTQDWDSSAWAEYTEAIEDWESVTNEWCPVPVEMNRNGNPRIAARFSEWMMGWPKGWVTDLITTNRRLYKEGMISRTAAMKMIGNGVVPQQAVMAIDTLIQGWFDVNISKGDPARERYEADERERVRRYQETRPKNAGVHSDQLHRAATRANRRKAKQRGFNHDDI